MSNELIFGFHSVEAILASEPERFIEIYALKGRDDKRLSPVIEQARQFGISVQFMQRKALDNKAKDEQHQGIIANVKAARVFNEKDLDEIIEREDTPFLLVLDGITDPHNLGACLRSADAAGVHAVIVPKDKSAKLNGSLTGPMAIVVGAEGEGMRRLTREHCDLLVKIPMAGTVSSLNVSVATGICLFEVLRQRAETN